MGDVVVVACPYGCSGGGTGEDIWGGGGGSGGSREVVFVTGCVTMELVLVRVLGFGIRTDVLVSVAVLGIVLGIWSGGSVAVGFSVVIASADGRVGFMGWVVNGVWKPGMVVLVTWSVLCWVSATVVEVSVWVVGVVVWWLGVWVGVLLMWSSSEVSLSAISYGSGAVVGAAFMLVSSMARLLIVEAWRCFGEWCRMIYGLRARISSSVMILGGRSSLMYRMSLWTYA